MNTTLLALLGFLCWTLFLLVLMEAVRSKLVLTRQVPPNGFNSENCGLVSLFEYKSYGLKAFTHWNISRS